MAVRLPALFDPLQCILERGRKWIPGTFPDRFEDMVKAARTPHRPLGLYDYHLHGRFNLYTGTKNM